MTANDFNLDFRAKPMAQWSLQDVYNYKKYKSWLETIDVPTKEGFGLAMHSDELSDEEKRAIAERVKEIGGYELLGD